MDHCFEVLERKFDFSMALRNSSRRLSGLAVFIVNRSRLTMNLPEVWACG
jgi:hypothetical protein